MCSTHLASWRHFPAQHCRNTISSMQLARLLGAAERNMCTGARTVAERDQSLGRGHQAEATSSAYEYCCRNLSQRWPSDLSLREDLPSSIGTRVEADYHCESCIASSDTVRTHFASIGPPPVQVGPRPTAPPHTNNQDPGRGTIRAAGIFFSQPLGGAGTNCLRQVTVFLLGCAPG